MTTVAEQPSSSPQDDISVKNECESETRVVRGLRVIRGLRFDCAPYSEIRGGMQLKHAPVIQGSTDARAFSVTFEIVEGSEDDVANDVGYARQKAEDAALRSVGCLVAEEPNKLVAEKNLPHTNELDGTEFQLCLIDARTEDKIGAASKGGPLPIFSTQLTGSPVTEAVKGLVNFESLRIHYLSVKHRDGRPVQRLRILVEPKDPDIKKKYPHLTYMSPCFESHSKTRLIRRKIRVGQVKVHGLPSDNGSNEVTLTIKDAMISRQSNTVQQGSFVHVLDRLRGVLLSFSSFAQLVHSSDIRDLMAKTKFYYDIASSKWRYLSESSTSDKEYLAEELRRLVELGQNACTSLYKRCSEVQVSLQQKHDELSPCKTSLEESRTLLGIPSRRDTEQYTLGKRKASDFLSYTEGQMLDYNIASCLVEQAEEFLYNITGCLRIAYSQVEAWGRLSANIQSSLPPTDADKSFEGSEKAQSAFPSRSVPQTSSSLAAGAFEARSMASHVISSSRGMPSIGTPLSMHLPPTSSQLSLGYGGDHRGALDAFTQSQFLLARQSAQFPQGGGLPLTAPLSNLMPNFENKRARFAVDFSMLRPPADLASGLGMLPGSQALTDAARHSWSRKSENGVATASKVTSPPSINAAR